MDDTVHGLKQQIDDLTEQQSEALESAVYIGMTPEEAKEYEQRRNKILQLSERLRAVERAQ